jgi:hypothetical protein
MLLQRRAWLCGLALILGIALATTPARAADVDKYLPDDTEVVMTVHVKQLTESALFKKYGADPIQGFLKDSDDVADALKDLGFDPLKDVDRIVIASPSGDDNDKGLIIIHGHFDLEKFKAKGEDAARTNGEHLKIHKRESGPVIYEVSHEKLPSNLFVALVDKNTMLASFGKDYVVDALKKSGNKETTLKNKDLKTQLAHTDAKQSLSIAMTGNAAAKSGELANVIPKDVLENLDAVGGGITVGEDIQVSLVVTAKTDEAAKAVSDKVSDGLNDALLALGAIVKVQKDFAPALDIVKSIKTTAKDKTVTVKGEVTAEQLEKLAQALQGIIGK